MTSIAEKVNTEATQDAYVYALVETASIKLLLRDGETVRKDLDAANKILDTFDSIDNVIHAAFYRVNADYFSVTSPHPPSLSNLHRANWTIPIITETRSFFSRVFRNRRPLQKTRHRAVRTISALLLSLARKFTISANYYFILSSMNCKAKIVHGYETYSSQ